jgi:hypothetical protein
VINDSKMYLLLLLFIIVVFRIVFGGVSEVKGNFNFFGDMFILDLAAMTWTSPSIKGFSI